MRGAGEDAGSRACFALKLRQEIHRAASMRAPCRVTKTTDSAARAGEKAKARAEFSAKDQARLEELRAKLGDPVGGRGAA